MEVEQGGGGGDLERVSVVGTGIARTPAKELSPLLLGSLAAGLAPEDLVHAVSLVTAARFAMTSFSEEALIGAVHAGTGAHALRRCLDHVRAATGDDVQRLRYELALCATESPHAHGLTALEELWAPPSDDAGLEDLLVALDEGEPDAAAEAASAVAVEDDDAMRTAWTAVLAAAASDQWLVLHGVKHTMAMYEDFAASAHPARGWYLAAAARTAAHATAREQPVAALVAARRS
jgi:hypothetical protein